MTTVEEKSNRQNALVLVLMSAGGVAVMVGAVVIAIAVSWWTSRVDESPEGRVKALIRWADKGDPGELADFFPPSLRSPGKQMAIALQRHDPGFRTNGGGAIDKTMDDFSVALIRMAILSKVAKCQVVNAVVEGDKARVYLKGLDGDKEEIPLIREEGRWYLTF